MPMEVEHLIPVALGGGSYLENLWHACALCNGYKGIQTYAIDPITVNLCLFLILASNVGMTTFSGVSTA